MPDNRKHRGAHPNDRKLFSPKCLPVIREAMVDLSWLRARGYGEKTSLKLVGNKYRLRERQRMLISRCVCTPAEKQLRSQKCLSQQNLKGQKVYIDGFNLLITLESALSQGFIFRAMDDCYRDLASIHGTYKLVSETGTALALVGKVLEEFEVSGVHWLFDKPVSNSGRMKVMLYELASEFGWPWEVSLEYNPDKILSNLSDVVVSSDSVILDSCEHWCNLARTIIDQHIPEANLIIL